MSVEFTYYDEEPIITVRFYPPHHGFEDVRAMNDATRSLVDQMQQPVYVIADITEVDINFSMLVSGLGEVRSETSKSLRDQTIIYLVGAGRLVESILNFAGQDQYGNQNYKVAASVEEALQQARAAIAGT
jgi:hypothetical protein